MNRPSFLEELRDPITGRIIPLKSNLPSPSGGGGAMVISAPEVEGPTVLSSVLKHVGEWSPARPGPPYFSPPGSPKETPAERVRPKESPPLLQRQPCLEGAALREAMGFLEGEGLEEPPRIQRRLIFPTGLQRFPGISSTHALFQAPSMDVNDLGTEKPEWVATKPNGGKRQRICTDEVVTAAPLVLKGHPANAEALEAFWKAFKPMMGVPFNH